MSSPQPELATIVTPTTTNNNITSESSNRSSRFTVTNATSKGQVATAPIRRGRGTFSHSLRTEEHERQAQEARNRSETASAFTSATVVTVSLPTPSVKSVTSASISSLTLINNNNNNNNTNDNNKGGRKNKSNVQSQTENLEAMLVGSSDKKDIPLATVPTWREQFGIELGEREEADTVRQVLFRGDKRRRCCIIVGDLQNTERPVTLKLFGHRGLKPFQLQNKVIRLINLSAGRQRLNRRLVNDEAALSENADVINTDCFIGENSTTKLIKCEDNTEVDLVTEGEDKSSDKGTAVNTELTTRTATITTATETMTEMIKKMNITDNNETTTCDTHNTITDNSINNSKEDCKYNIAAWEQEVAKSNVTDENKREFALPSEQQQEKQQEKECKEEKKEAQKGKELEELKEEQQQQSSKVEANKSDMYDADKRHTHNDDVRQEESSMTSTVIDRNATETAETSKNNCSAINAKQNNKSYVTTTYITSHGEDNDELEYTDIDQYWENVDEVVPLTVQNDDNVNEFVTERRVANSPLLTAKYFDSLTEYFLREFRYLLSLEDVRMQNVTVDVSLGAAYYCLPRHCSYTTPLKNATFAEFVERINQESLQLYFIKDCPECVLRAVDMECGALYNEANLTTVRIIFFSNERQSKTIARATWDLSLNKFRLLDVENIGVTFNWTIFSIDETYAIAKAKAQSSKQKATVAMTEKATTTTTSTTTTPTTATTEEEKMIELHNVNNDCDNNSNNNIPTTTNNNNTNNINKISITIEELKMRELAVEAAMRNKTVAYPFEVEFRAFRRWKQRGNHPAHALAEAILDKLSIAESNLLQHGSNVGYERMDLTHVCEVDYASDDYNVEAIIVDHTARGRPAGTDLLVDNTTSLHIENFAAARQLKEKIAQYGEANVAAMQNANNNNYMRSRAHKLGIRIKLNDDRRDNYQFNAFGQQNMFMTEEEMREALKPPAKLTFFRSTGSTIHWKFKPMRKAEDNIAPMTEALRFVQQVLNTANDIERTLARESANVKQKPSA